MSVIPTQADKETLPWWAAQVALVVNPLLALVRRRNQVVRLTGQLDEAFQGTLLLQGGDTVTLPAPYEGAVITVKADASASPGSPVTVNGDIDGVAVLTITAAWGVIRLLGGSDRWLTV